MSDERFRLKDKCLFVDAGVYDEMSRKPAAKVKPSKPPSDGKIELPHVMDKSASPATYVMVNAAAAFIARFIVMGLDKKEIIEIIKSEYGPAVADPAADYTTVKNLLAPYLEPLPAKRPYQSPQTEGDGTHTGSYELDFRVNWFVTGGFKGPI